jgi:restriction system protein
MLSMTDRAGRLRRRKSRSSDGWLVSLLCYVPWWVTCGLAVAAIAVGAQVHALALGIISGVVIALAGLVAAEDTIRGHRLARHSRSVDDLRRMSWQDFERLVAEAFRRSGYRADLTSRGADGGVDIILTRSGSKTLVQCKQNTSRLGPGAIRELAGVMASEDVTDGIVVACGGVGDEGQAFAKRNRIRIIDGSALVGLLVEKETWTELPRGTATTTAAAVQGPSCPRCHSTMVRRNSRRGFFWACSRFPSCRGTRALEGNRAH